MIWHKAASFGRKITARNRVRHLSVILLLFGLLGSCACKAATAGISPDEQTIARAAKNKAALSKALDNIEAHRKASFKVKILDARGRPVSGAPISVIQTSHAFKFGCYLKMDDLAPEKLPGYKLRFGQLFNYAVIGTYWDYIENKKGVEDWTWFDREASLADELGIETAAAPVLWGTNKFGTPGWLPDREKELLPVLERRVRSAVTRDPGITDWEIVNEPLAPKEDLIAQRIKGDYIDSAFRWARESAPGNRLLINEYGIFGSLEDHNYNRERYHQLVDRLIRNGTPIDVIGIQAHANGEWYEPVNVAEQLERYSELGKPVQITEFSVQTHKFKDRKPLEISGSYRSGGVWDADKQAEFYREFYTIAFGSPGVDAVVTWGLDEERAWLPGIGLIDRNGKPTPAYDVLDTLINHEWKTRLAGITDKDGLYEFRGFLGDYELTVTGPGGRTTVSKFTLGGGKSELLVIRLG
jgi:GH35 family endo-1,4-beta-xylanase